MSEDVFRSGQIAAINGGLDKAHYLQSQLASERRSAGVVDEVQQEKARTATPHENARLKKVVPFAKSYEKKVGDSVTPGLHRTWYGNETVLTKKVTYADFIRYWNWRRMSYLTASYEFKNLGEIQNDFFEVE